MAIGYDDGLTFEERMAKITAQTAGATFGRVQSANAYKVASRQAAKIQPTTKHRGVTIKVHAPPIVWERLTKRFGEKFVTDGRMSPKMERTYTRMVARVLTQSFKSMFHKEGDTSFHYVPSRTSMVGSFKGAGYGTGKLYNSILVKSISKKKFSVGYSGDASYRVEYSFPNPTSEDWGWNVARGRRAAFIPIAPLIEWAERKMAAGTLRANPTDILGFAHAISKNSGPKKTRKARRTSERIDGKYQMYKKPNRDRPAQIENWNSWNNNEVRANFNKIYNRIAPRYHRMMLKDVAKNYAK